MKYVSLFSGIESASVAWQPLGWEPMAFSEIEKFPCELLTTRFPDVPNEGDISKVDWSKHRGAVDLVIGGSPCQSFSVAGLRRGLADPRGNLMLEYLRAIAEICPKWIIWENVPGALSADEGMAFGTLLGSLEKLGYGFSHRVLDAQFFGVAQRRRRVFVVGCLGSWQRAAAVLFESESLSGNTKTSKEKREELTSASRNSSAYAIAGNTIGRQDHTGGNGVGVQEDVSYTLTSTDQHAVVLSNGEDVVGSLCARDYKGVGSQYVEEGKVVCMAPSFSKRPGQQIAAKDDGTSYAITTGQPPSVVGGAKCAA